MASNTVIVDDNDPRITYNGPWILGGNATSVEFDGTTHAALTAGAAATFTFSGTSVAVFGTITSLSVSPFNPSSTYNIDGSEVATFTPTEDNSIHYRQQFFQSPLLASRSHTLVITSNVNNGYLFLDYIQFTPSSNTSPTTLTLTTTFSVIQGQTPSASQSTASVMLTTSSQITTTTQGSSASSRSSNAPVGAIVGGVIGVAALVVIATIALCLIRRSRRMRQGWQDSGSQMSPFQNTAQGGSGSDNAIREGTNIGLNKALSNPRDTNLHSQGSSRVLQFTLTTETPRYLQNQEVATNTDVDSPPEYDYSESTRL